MKKKKTYGENFNILAIGQQAPSQMKFCEGPRHIDALQPST